MLYRLHPSNNSKLCFYYCKNPELFYGLNLVEEFIVLGQRIPDKTIDLEGNYWDLNNPLDPQSNMVICAGAPYAYWKFRLPPSHSYDLRVIELDRVIQLDNGKICYNSDLDHLLHLRALNDSRFHDDISVKYYAQAGFFERPNPQTSIGSCYQKSCIKSSQTIENCNTDNRVIIIMMNSPFMQAMRISNIMKHINNFILSQDFVNYRSVPLPLPIPVLFLLN